MKLKDKTILGYTFLKDLYGEPVVIPDEEFKNIYEKFTNDELTQEEKEVVDLRGIANGTYLQISRELGVSVNKVRHIYTHAMCKIKRRVGVGQTFAKYKFKRSSDEFSFGIAGKGKNIELQES